MHKVSIDVISHMIDFLGDFFVKKIDKITPIEYDMKDNIMV